MDVEKAKQLKAQMEQKIIDAVADFEKKVGLAVTDIYIRRAQKDGRRSYLVGADCEIQLESD